MATDTDRRPSPEALLEQARKERRGTLKIFLGAAPGVGKTYAMLESGRAARRDGLDVVVGIIETHGRKETEAQIGDLEIIPRRLIDYRGKPFEEMDLDAILARRPGIVLVDELAHTNVPGARHPKRYQDVEELLQAGIDVWSTLNIQHLESLNDVVERIAGVKVRETLPDGVLKAADEIEMIDLPPQELQKRLAEGKVYAGDQARRAVESFFTTGNLTALREMALRQAAERVDAQMVSYMRSHAIAGPWPTRERILVAIGPEDGIRLVRAAKRVADRRQALWTAVTVETPRPQSDAAKDALAQALRLAEQLGGDTAVLHGDDITGELLAYARANNVSQILLGRSRPRRVWRRFDRGMTDDVYARADEFDLLIIGGGEPTLRSRGGLPRPELSWHGFVLATGAIALATGAAFGVSLIFPVSNVALVFLLGVLLVASRYGLAPSIYASVIAFLSYNFFFLEPLYSFEIGAVRDLSSIGFFLVAAVVTGQLAGRLRSQVETTRQNQRRTQTLYEFSRKVAAAASRDDVLWAVCHHVAATIRGRSLVLLPMEGQLRICGAYPPEDRLDDRATAAAMWAWTKAQRAGRGSDTLPASDWLFLPLRTQRGALGVLGVQGEEAGRFLAPDESRLLDALADQAALAIERTNLVADIEAAEIRKGKEQLRTALLSSLSHDLRTPLVSILGASTSLLNYDDELEEEQRRVLAGTIQEEAERLNRFVQNLLDMTRLEAGGLTLRTDWVDIRDVVAAALDRAKRIVRGRPIRLEIASDLPLLRLDPVLMEQVLFNLLDNACKYSPAAAPITVYAIRQGGRVLVEVCDQGPGIAAENRERVFDMFYRVQGADRQSAGTGLGLAICRGIVEAQGGTIEVLSGLHGEGACLAIRLPVEDPPEAPADTDREG